MGDMRCAVSRGKGKMIAARENALWRRARIDGLVREDIFITSLPGSRAQNAQL